MFLRSGVLLNSGSLTHSAPYPYANEFGQVPPWSLPTRWHGGPQSAWEVHAARSDNSDHPPW